MLVIKRAQKERELEEERQHDLKEREEQRLHLKALARARLRVMQNLIPLYAVRKWDPMVPISLLMVALLILHLLG
jgi:hypothetical protein